VKVYIQVIKTKSGQIIPGLTVHNSTRDETVINSFHLSLQLYTRPQYTEILEMIYIDILNSDIYAPSIYLTV